MNELKMIEAHAKLEGVGILKESGCFWTSDKIERYNPISNLTLNCMARDKYHVEIDYDNMQAAIYLANEWFIVEYYEESELNHAVIEVILKANGLWEENK